MPNSQLALHGLAPHKFQRAPNPPEFAQPHLSVGSKRGRPQRGGTNLGVFVPIWPVMRMPG